MACTQLVTPNLDPVIYQSGHALTDWWGWCLAYGQTAFKSGWAGSNAWEGWIDHVKIKHLDQNIPSGMYVPIWFSGYGGLGHVCIYKDGQVWSSPWHHKPTADVMSSIAEVERIYGVKYVGWSEDIGGTQVVEYTPDPVVVVSPPPAPAAKYQVTETYSDGKQIQLNKQPTNLWGMNYDFDYMVAHPVEVHNQGEVWVVTNKVHHQDGSDYYRREGQQDGFNVVDCDNYTPPPPPTPLPLPAPPVKGIPAETYTLVTSLPTYPDDLGAINRANGSTTLPPGLYYVWNKIGNVYQLGTDNIHEPTNNWVNTLDNIPPPPVITPPPLPPSADSSATITGSFKWFHSDHNPEEYTVLKNIVVYDMLHGGKPIRIDTGTTIEIYGHFVKDGHTYLRPLTGLDQQALYYFYGIRTTDTATFSGAPFLESKLDWVDKAKVLWESVFEKAVKSIKSIKSIDGVFRRKK